jgi:hypothetical protein
MRRLQDVSGGKWTELSRWLRENANEWETRLLDGPNGPRDDSQHAQQQSRTFAEIYARTIAMRRAVWCWYWAEEESAAMWSLYANAGIAVRTSVADLKEALHRCKRELVLSRVKYTKRDAASSHPSRINPESRQGRELIHRPHLVKGVEYSHEQEVRVSAACHPEEKGLWLDDIEEAKLIEEVVISPSIPHDEAEAILGMVRNRLEREPELGTAPKSTDISGGQKHGGGFSELAGGQFKSGPILRRSSLLGWRRDDDAEEAIFRNYCSRKGIQLREDLPPPLDAL